jgi:PAS domain S-box-containing protein
VSSDALSETDAAALAGLGRAFIEATLDLLPTPVLLVEPGSAAVTFANRAADELAGGRFPKAAGVELYPDTYFCTDAEGRRVPAEQMPGARVARGERLHAFEMDWHLPHGTRSLLLSGDIVRDAAGEQVGVVVFEDATRLKASERERADSAALLDTLLESAPVGLAFFDRDLRYARVNRELERINGVSAAEHEGRRVGEVLPEMPASVEDGLRRTLESGEPIVDLEVTGRTPALPGVDRRWLCGWYPVRHRDGETIGLGAVVVDVTERSRLLEAERAARLRAERAEQRAAFLARAGEVLASSLNYEETLARVARIAVPDKADWCAVDMLRRDGQLERLAVAHTDPAKERLAAELQSRYPADLDAAAGIGHVVRTGQAELYADIPDELLRTVAQDD